MWGGHATRRPFGRLFAAALLTVVGITAVHGAASATVPAGAIASAHASIGAALIHQGAAAGRDDEEVGAGRAAVQRATEELLPPGEERPPAAIRPANPYGAFGAREPAPPRDTWPDSAPRSRVVPGHPTRAPPA